MQHAIFLQRNCRGRLFQIWWSVSDLSTSYLSHPGILIWKPIRSWKKHPDQSEISIRRNFRKPHISIQTKIILRSYIKKFVEMIPEHSNPWSGTTCHWSGEKMLFRMTDLRGLSISGGLRSFKTGWLVVFSSLQLSSSIFWFVLRFETWWMFHTQGVQRWPVRRLQSVSYAVQRGWNPEENENYNCNQSHVQLEQVKTLKKMKIMIEKFLFARKILKCIDRCGFMFMIKLDNKLSWQILTSYQP